MTLGKTPPMPEPSGVQLLPSHWATLVAGFAPDMVKLPPAYSLLPDTASAYTPKEVPGNPPASPGPKADQLFPSHLAMLVAGLPPAAVNAPPAYRLLPDAASAYTRPLTPEPRADQLFPSHLATNLAAVPPAFLNAPPA